MPPEFWTGEIRCIEEIPAVAGAPAFEANWTTFDKGDIYDETYLPSYTPSSNELLSSLAVAVDSGDRCHVLFKGYPFIGGQHTAVVAWVDNGSGGAWGTPQVVLGIVDGEPEQAGYGWAGRGIWRSHGEPMSAAASPADDDVALFFSSNHDRAYGATEIRRLASPPSATAGDWSNWHYNALTEIGGTGQDIIPLAACASDDNQYVIGCVYETWKPAIGYRSGGGVTLVEQLGVYSLGTWGAGWGATLNTMACLDDNGWCHAVFPTADEEYNPAVIYARPTSATTWTFSVLSASDWVAGIAFESVSGSLVAMLCDSAGADLSVIRSSDGGATWSSPAVVFDSATSEPNIVAIANGTLLCVFGAWGGSDGLGTALRYITSTDGGATWSATAVVPDSAATNKWQDSFETLSGRIRMAAAGNTAVIAGLTDANQIRAIRFAPS